MLRHLSAAMAPAAASTAAAAEELAAKYDRDGFVVVRQLLPAAELIRIQASLADFRERVVPTLPDDFAFFDRPGSPETCKYINFAIFDAADPDDSDDLAAQLPREEDWQPLTRLCQHPAFSGAARAVLREPFDVKSRLLWFNKSAAASEQTPPHQDNGYFGLTPPACCTVWLALDPISFETGALRYIPGSHVYVRPHHKSGVRGFSQSVVSYTEADRAAEVAVEMQPGDAVVHHCNV